MCSQWRVLKKHRQMKHFTTRLDFFPKCLICLDVRVKTLKLKQKETNGLRLLSSAQRLVYVKKKYNASE